MLSSMTMNFNSNTIRNVSGTQNIKNTVIYQGCNVPASVNSFHKCSVEIPYHHGLPSPVNNFCGRTDELKAIRDYFKISSRAVLITGLGGIGKTELVKAFADKHENEYDIILYIIGDNTSSLYNTFYKIAGDFGVSIEYYVNCENGNRIPRAKSIKDITGDVYGKCYLYHRALVIFDNVDIEEDIVEYLPKKFSKTLNVLITSRNQNWDFYDTNVITLELFTRETALEFIKKSLNVKFYDEDDVDELCETLQYFPLALKHAVGFIVTQNKESKLIGKIYTIGDYINEYNCNKLEFLKYHDKYSIINTWSVTIEKLKQYGDVGFKAIENLKCMAYLPSDNISPFIFQVETDEINRTAILILESYSMINIDDNLISIHRLVQEVLKVYIEEGCKKDEILDKVVKLLGNVTYHDESSSFMFMCQEGVEDVVEYMLNMEGFDVDQKNKYGATALFSDQRLNIFKILVESGKFDLYEKDCYGFNILMYACQRGYMDVLKYLLENGEFDLKEKNDTGCTMLTYACMGGNIEMVDYLLNSGEFDVDDRDNSGHTILMNVCREGKLEMVKYLLNNIKYDVNDKDSNRRSVIMHACFGGDVDIVKLLFETGLFDWNEKDYAERDALMHACQKGCLEIVEYLVNNGGFDMNTKDVYGWNCIMHAYHRKRMDVVKYLNDTGKFDLNVKDVSGNTVLMSACRDDDVEAVRYLIDTEKFDVNEMDANGRTILMYACFKNDLSMFNLLLERGICTWWMRKLRICRNRFDLYVEDDDGFTVFHWAIILRRREMLDILLEHGYDPNVENKMGFTSIDICEKIGNLEVVTILKRKNCKSDLQKSKATNEGFVYF